LELQTVFRKQVGVSTSKNPAVLRRSWLWQAVSNATGEKHHTIAAPATDLTFGSGVLPCLRSVRFTNGD
jgi:hypothetical protein